VRSRVALAALLVGLGPRVHAEEGKLELGLFAGASLLEARTRPGTGNVALPDVVRPPPPIFVITSASTLGPSFLLGFRVGYRMTGRVAVEATFGAAPSATQRTEYTIVCDLRPCPLAIPSDILVRRPTGDKVAAYHYDAGALVSLGGRLVQPFLSGGLGGVTYDAPERARTNFAFVVGVGVRIGTGSFQARVEATDHIILDHYLTQGTEHDVQLLGGVTVRVR
jgi:hypothetical protein